MARNASGVVSWSIGINGRCEARTVEIALRNVDIGVGHRGPYVVDIQSVGGEGLRVDLDTHRRPLAAADADEADTALLGDFLDERCLADVLQRDQIEALRCHRKREDRSIGRIDLGINRRGGKITRQQTGGRIDRRLHLLLGDVEIEG